MCLVERRVFGFATNFSVLCHDRFLDHFSGFSIDWMSNIPTDAIFLFLVRHTDDIARGPSDDLNVSDYEAVIESERCKSPKHLLVDEINTYLGNPHLSPPLLGRRLAPRVG